MQNFITCSFWDRKYSMTISNTRTDGYSFCFIIYRIANFNDDKEISRIDIILYITSTFRDPNSCQMYTSFRYRRKQFVLSFLYILFVKKKNRVRLYIRVPHWDHTVSKCNSAASWPSSAIVPPGCTFFFFIARKKTESFTL